MIMPWYVDLQANLTYNFNTTNPEVTLSGTGVINLDGTYWVTIDNGNFVMASQDNAYTLYFTDADTAPNCSLTASGKISENDTKDLNNRFASSLSVSPNPSMDVVTLSSSFNLKALRGTVFDISGKRIKSFETANAGKTYLLRVSDLEAGVYILKLEEPETGMTFIRRLVKQ